MKTRLLVSVIALGIFGIAQARQDQVYPQVNVVHPSSANAGARGYSMDCAPPNTAEECAQFHKEIRKNFSTREIGMLFGASTAFAESRSAAPWIAQRYDNFARAYDEAHLTAFASTK